MVGRSDEARGMSYLFGVLLIFSILLLFFHYRWALIDPHNPAVQPGSVVLVGRSLLVTAGLVAAATLHALQPGVGSVMGSFCLGMVVGPAIVWPFNLRSDEEPSWLSRKFAALQDAGQGSIWKATVAGSATWLIGLTGLPKAWYVVLMLFALGGNLAKLGTAIGLLREPKIQTLLETARLRWTRDEIYPLGLVGTLCLFLWLCLFYSVADPVAHSTMQDWLAVFALITSIFLAVVL
jgi:hypothetical protein